MKEENKIYYEIRKARGLSQKRRRQLRGYATYLLRKNPGMEIDFELLKLVGTVPKQSTKNRRRRERDWSDYGFNE